MCDQILFFGDASQNETRFATRPTKDKNRDRVGSVLTVSSALWLGHGTFHRLHEGLKRHESFIAKRALLLLKFILPILWAFANGLHNYSIVPFDDAATRARGRARQAICKSAVLVVLSSKARSKLIPVSLSQNFDQKSASALTATIP